MQPTLSASDTNSYRRDLEMQEHPALPRYSTLSLAAPQYSTVFNDPHSTLLDSHYSFHLKNSKGIIWASMNLQKDNRTRSAKAPVFAEGVTIAGSVTVDLESPQVMTIQALTLAVSMHFPVPQPRQLMDGTQIRGRAITGANEGGTHWFLDRTVPLWSKDQGDPHAYQTALSGSSTGNDRSGSGKLCGMYSFPFSLSLPASDSPDGSLPESFNE